MLLFFFLLIHPSSTTTTTTILLTGETIPTNCNPTNCTLTLTDRGQLLVLSPNISTIQSSSPPFTPGQYAALLRPNNQITIYGPSIWSTKTNLHSVRTTNSTNLSPVNARRHMFSSQVLDENSMLAGGDHRLVMKGDCGLELVRVGEEGEEVVWESGTRGGGGGCFARFDQRGQLAVVDARFDVLWASKAGEVDGFYVLVVEDGGRAAVYGPAVWSSGG